MQGIKLELFIFDTLPMAEKLSLMEVPRDCEFAPVKNAPGSASDSPDTARQAIMSLHKRSASVLHTFEHVVKKLVVLLSSHRLVWSRQLWILDTGHNTLRRLCTTYALFAYGLPALRSVLGSKGTLGVL